MLRCFCFIIVILFSQILLFHFNLVFLFDYLLLEMFKAQIKLFENVQMC